MKISVNPIRFAIVRVKGWYQDVDSSAAFSPTSCARACSAEISACFAALTALRYASGPERSAHQHPLVADSGGRADVLQKSATTLMVMKRRCGGTYLKLMIWVGMNTPLYARGDQ